MSRLKLGPYIRRIDFLSAKDDNYYEYSDDNPGNQLINYEKICDSEDNFNFEELKDGYSAFREKVCIPKFPGRHSPPYWVAHSAACVLDRLKQNFEDDEDKQLPLGHEMVYTWIALFSAKPSSGHLDLMDKFTGDLFENYIKASKADELVKIMSRMKIKFSYDAKNETDEEQTYASFLSNKAVEIFRHFTEEQSAGKAVLQAFLDLRMFYQEQISKLSPVMARCVGYLVRDMASKFPEDHPYQNLTDVQTIKSHLSTIEESLCTFEGDLESLRDEETLKEIVKYVRETAKLKDFFPTLMALIVRYSKRKTPLENGGQIYDLFRLYLFRNLENYCKPDGSIFDECVAMMKSVLTDGSEVDEAKQQMIEEALSDCVKVKNLTAPQKKALVDLLLTMLKSGRRRMVDAVKNTLETKELNKTLEWKNLTEEAKQFLAVIGSLNAEQIETDGGDYDDVIRKLEETVEVLLELFRKGKKLREVLKEHVALIFNCLEIKEPNKAQLSSKASDSKFLIITVKDTDVIDSILHKVDELLKDTYVEWNSDRTSTVDNLLEAVVQSYKDSGKNVTDYQNAKFMSIFATCCEGDCLEDKLVNPDEENIWTVFYSIFLLGISYISLHCQSKSLSRCVPLIKNCLKVAKMAADEEHDDLMTASFSSLNFVGTALSPDIADITPEVVDLYLSVEKVTDLLQIMLSLYEFNPEPFHAKLELFIDKMEDLGHNERIHIATILGQIARKHGQIFSEDQVGKVIKLATEDDQQQIVYLNSILYQICTQYPKPFCKHFSKLLDDSAFSDSVLIFRVMIIVRVACFDKTLVGKAAEFALKHIKPSDPTTTQQILSQMFLLVQTDRESMIKYKPNIEKLQKASKAPDLEEYFKNLINALEGKSIEGVFEDMQQVQENIGDLDKKVGATMNTVVSLGEHVIEQGKDISKVRTDVDNLDERVDVIEEDIADTKVKVEEIDNKTMTNAPKWSRDLTKLMNPKAENDWRLLAKRLGYSNDDTRAWAQQHDPCMALLSEWYATRKTSEANFGILTNLQEMNRVDGAVIVENAMKATEDVVEDEEFEYPSPPPIFLSYQWGVQNEVKLLKQHLNMAGYECWMDIGQMGGGDKLFNKIDSGIRAAKVIICCTTEKYAQSPNCNREVNLSVNLGKPIIPLLMEKMSWPPKGSMGPIFSEYLFIRFFQRGGEETKDQRYWPVAKFQELLMQMNFFSVPDQKLIKPEYSNWWTPIVEDINIDKNKSAKTSSATTIKTAKDETTADASPLVFLSYQWGKQPQVKLLYERLVSLGYTVWMDIFQMGGGDSLYDKIDRGLRGCKVVVSCVTPKYALSANCRREVSLADSLKRPIIPLLLESMTWPPDGPMSMIFTELLFINVYRDSKIQEKWTGPKVDELLAKIKLYIPDKMDERSNVSNEKESVKSKQSERSGANQPNAKITSTKAKENTTRSGANETANKGNKTVTNHDLETQKIKGKEPNKLASKSCVLL